MKSLSHVLVVPEENRRRCDWITMFRQDPRGDSLSSGPDLSTAVKYCRWWECVGAAVHLR